MKKPLFFSLIFSICFIFPQTNLAQCEVDAGPLKYVCVDKNGWISQDTLGGSPTILSGTAPFTYKWEFFLHVGRSYQVTASDMLADTTVANPLLVHSNPLHEGADKATVFTLRVTDANGAVCTDSQSVFFSQYAAIPDLTSFWIDQGDSMQIYSTVHGGIPPLKYSWSPNYHISDTAVVAPFVWPHVSTLYICEIEDSVGCINTFNNEWTILVRAVGLEKDMLPKGQVQLYPNPISDQSVLRVETAIQLPMELVIFDLTGKKVYSGPIQPNQDFPLGKIPLRNGSYLYGIFTKNQELRHAGKFVKGE